MGHRSVGQIPPTRMKTPVSSYCARNCRAWTAPLRWSPLRVTPQWACYMGEETEALKDKPGELPDIAVPVKEQSQAEPRSDSRAVVFHSVWPVLL